MAFEVPMEWRLKGSRFTAYKKGYVNFHPCTNVHNSLDLPYDAFKDQPPLPSQTRQNAPVLLSEPDLEHAPRSCP